MRIISSVVLAVLPLCLMANGGNDLKLRLPPFIYAVPGVEANVHFDNIVLTLRPDNYVFDVDCEKGSNFEKRWSFVPSDKDVGTYPWRIKVLDTENNVVAKGESTLIISPAKAGEGKKTSLLLIGDSLTDQGKYPRRLDSLFKRPGNTSVKFVGSHSGGGKPVEPGGVCLEGYGGWTWCQFTLEQEPVPPKVLPYRTNKFIANKNGKWVFDFQQYLDKYNNGAAPDFIVVMLGTNDIFMASDENINETIKSVFKDMDILLKALASSAPQAAIGIALTPPPAHSQDAFGNHNNYKCGQTRWQFKRNQHRLVSAMMEKFASEKNKSMSLIPVYINLDTENGFPFFSVDKCGSILPYELAKDGTKIQGNGVHPGDGGYDQIGDSIYCWMKYQLSK